MYDPHGGWTVKRKDKEGDWEEGGDLREKRKKKNQCHDKIQTPVEMLTS